MRGLPGRPEAAGVSEPRGGDASLLCAGPSVLRMDGGGQGQMQGGLWGGFGVVRERDGDRVVGGLDHRGGSGRGWTLR